jgi:hypothetical protein
MASRRDKYDVDEDGGMDCIRYDATSPTMLVRMPVACMIANKKFVSKTRNTDNPTNRQTDKRLW